MKIIKVIDAFGMPGFIALSENLLHADHVGKLKPVAAGFCDPDFTRCRGLSTSIEVNGFSLKDQQELKALMKVNLH